MKIIKKIAVKRAILKKIIGTLMCVIHVFIDGSAPVAQSNHLCLDQHPDIFTNEFLTIIPPKSRALLEDYCNKITEENSLSPEKIKSDLTNIVTKFKLISHTPVIIKPQQKLFTSQKEFLEKENPTQERCTRGAVNEDKILKGSELFDFACVIAKFRNIAAVKLANIKKYFDRDIFADLIEKNNIKQITSINKFPETIIFTPEGERSALLYLKATIFAPTVMGHYLAGVLLGYPPEDVEYFYIRNHGPNEGKRLFDKSSIKGNEFIEENKNYNEEELEKQISNFIEWDKY